MYLHHFGKSTYRGSHRLPKEKILCGVISITQGFLSRPRPLNPGRGVLWGLLKFFFPFFIFYVSYIFDSAISGHIERKPLLLGTHEQWSFTADHCVLSNFLTFSFLLSHTHDIPLEQVVFVHFSQKHTEGGSWDYWVLANSRTHMSERLKVLYQTFHDTRKGDEEHSTQFITGTFWIYSIHCCESKQDHQWWRYHRRLLVYQSPYF